MSREEQHIPLSAALRRAAGPLAVATLATGYGLRALKQRYEATAPFHLDDEPEPGSPEFDHFLEGMTGEPVRPGNRVEVYRNGREIFPAMLEAIAQAERSILFATYIYWRGEIARRFADVLSSRSREGVEVRVLLDAVGASRMRDGLARQMGSAGCRIEWFRPPKWHTIHRFDNRTHRKILVCDGRVAFTGGVGIAEQWTGDAQDPDHWRDTHLRIDGPSARGLVAGFQENWAEATRELLGGANVPDIEPYSDGVAVHVARSSARHGTSEIQHVFHAAIACARERIRLTTAYFAPDRSFVDGLIQAAERGVDIQILTNGRNAKSEVVRQAGQRRYEALLEAGVRVFEYTPTLLHAKVLTVDGRWSSVGSVNLDHRSFALNDELNASVSDGGVAGVLDRHFDDDRDRSEEIDLERWRARGALPRLKERVSSALQQEL
ncbi:MAG: cardiolipin synthase B [Actinobacteria bacterium]|nr:cardiolipin synthase B [Actinomycetota bacterium]